MPVLLFDVTPPLPGLLILLLVVVPSLLTLPPVVGSFVISDKDDDRSLVDMVVQLKVFILTSVTLVVLRIVGIFLS